MGLEKLQVYKLSMNFGEDIWEIVNKWNNLAKDTIGKQLVRSADSIAANISEGFGRYHFGESKHFYYYARGSLFECKTWVSKSFSRKLIDENIYNELTQNIETLAIKLNNFINSTGKSKNNK